MTILDSHTNAGASETGTVVLKSVCRSCHGGCGTLLHVKDGVLVKVVGDPQSPLNHGRLCPIGTVTADIVNHPNRLKYPQRRVGPPGTGQWKRIIPILTTSDRRLPSRAARLT
jgi:anaerobic selenocysteine-containing dehydrogenase